MCPQMLRITCDLEPSSLDANYHRQRMLALCAILVQCLAFVEAVW